MNTVYDDVKNHLLADAKNRIYIAVQGGYNGLVFDANDLTKIKPEGNGLRIAKLFVFASQVRFCKVA